MKLAKMATAAWTMEPKNKSQSVSTKVGEVIWARSYSVTDEDISIDAMRVVSSLILGDVQPGALATRPKRNASGVGPVAALDVFLSHFHQVVEQ